MYVEKRSGCLEEVYFDKITQRIKNLSKDLKAIDATKIASQVISSVIDGIKTRELDVLAAEICAAKTSHHPDFGILAARIAMSNLHKETIGKFSSTIEKLYTWVNPQTGKSTPLVSEMVFRMAKHVDDYIRYDRDYQFDYFGIRTLEKSYLMKAGSKIVERPQDMFMRVALGIHGDDLAAVKETYDMLSCHDAIHASPTLFSAGTQHPQMSSCFLLSMTDDSIEGIYDTLKRCALISKRAGGIGLNVSNIRAKDSYIGGTGGFSNGIVPMLRVFNTTSKYVDQGGNKRPGSIAIYLEPWHADIEDFLNLKLNTGKEEARARDLFYALWIPDLFMKRVENDEKWTLLCPNKCPGLNEVWGEEFEELYTRYEREGRGDRVVNAQDLFRQIITVEAETGTPYVMYKDACNRKSNQQNLGTIKGSNLCSEIVQYTSSDEVAVCNLASLSLPNFVENDNFNFDRFHQVVKILVRNLNKIIDLNEYPIQEAKTSNLKHRPIGLGVQGLAETFIKLRIPYDSDEAKELNKRIFERLYFAAVETSCELAQRDGPYESFGNSPASKGLLQFDLWGKQAETTLDWKSLKTNIQLFGMRNSLLVAPMPTASTAQIFGNTESFEPNPGNIYIRRVNAGEFPVVNKYLINDLIERGLWSDNLRQEIIRDRGSIQKITSIPEDIKSLYKTVWEMSQKTVVIQMAADRGPYIDQSQSLNIHIAEPTYGKLFSMHFCVWKAGLKGMYYLRSKPAANSIQFTVCTRDCLSCSA